MERCPKRNDKCPLYFSKLGCHTIRHHIYFPKSAFRTEIEQEFRGLDRNIVPMCKNEEQTLHNTTLPPSKPSVEVMKYCIQAQRLRQGLEV